MSSMNLSLKNGSSFAQSSPSKLSCFVYLSFVMGGRDWMYSLMVTQTQMVLSRTRVPQQSVLHFCCIELHYASITPSRGVDFGFLLNKYVVRNSLIIIMYLYPVAIWVLCICPFFLFSPLHYWMC